MPPFAAAFAALLARFFLARGMAAVLLVLGVTMTSLDGRRPLLLFFRFLVSPFGGVGDGDVAAGGACLGTFWTLATLFAGNRPILPLNRP